MKAKLAGSHPMQEKVLVYSRFPKALMQRIGERFDLLDAAGKPPHDVFPADQLSGIRAMITAGGKAPPRPMMEKISSLWALACFRPPPHDAPPSAASPPTHAAAPTTPPHPPP